MDALPPDASGKEDLLGADRQRHRLRGGAEPRPVRPRLRDLRPIAAAAHARGALLVAVVTEVVSRGAVTPPGAMGADIVACEGQSLGNAVGFGGPYLGHVRGAGEVRATDAGTIVRRDRRPPTAGAASC